MEPTEPATHPAPATAHHHSSAQPSIHQAVQDAMRTPGETSQTFHAKLNSGEEHWKWKFGLRVITIIIGIIGIGCMGWATSKSTSGLSYNNFIYDQLMFQWSHIPFTLSVIWCSICILVLVLRRPPRPVHPGVAVGIDLVLWLAFIPTLMFAVFGVLSVMDFGSGGYIDDYSSGYGHYSLQPNGTWTYVMGDYYNNYQRNRTCDNGDSSYLGYGSRGFSSCTDLDQYVNDLWQSKTRRVNTDLTGTVCQGLALLLHFALFVWACVDTARRNRGKSSMNAERLAEEIVTKMVREGAIVQAPGASRQMQHPGHSAPESHITEHYGNEKAQV